jgi:ubiquinone/menaquinone biosynthesis C-methylase UbiE
MDRGKVFPASHARSLLNPARRLVQSPKRTIAAASFPVDGRILEVGCGPGFFSPYIARAVPQGQVVLLDLQREMLTIAKERVDAGFVQADATRVPIASAQFDGVFVATMLGEVPDRAACIEEARRLLRPCGVLAIAETRRDSDFIKLSALRALAEPRGFAFAGRRGPSWQYVARFQAISTDGSGQA